jgi:hypothetical protein
VMLLHQGAISGLDLRRRGGGGHAKHLVGVASGGRPGQGHAKATAILALEAVRPSTATKKAPR